MARCWSAIQYIYKLKWTIYILDIHMYVYLYTYLARRHWQPNGCNWDDSSESLGICMLGCLSYAMLGNRTRTRLESATSSAQLSYINLRPSRTPPEVSHSPTEWLVLSLLRSRIAGPMQSVFEGARRWYVRHMYVYSVYTQTQLHIHMHIHMLTFDVFHFFFRFHSLRDLKTFK